MRVQFVIPVLSSILILGTLGLSQEGFAITFDPPILLQQPIPTENSRLGMSVSMSGDKVLVGSAFDDTTGLRTGKAYLFDATDGSLLQTFVNPTPQFNDRFGGAVAISGDKVVIGAFLHRGGEAYLFDATDGSLIQTLANPGGFRFGHSVAISGDNVIVGTQQANLAYLFDATDGSLLQTFVNPEPSLGRFGFSVAADGNNILIGSLSGEFRPPVGRAYLFDATDGSLLQTFVNPTTTGDRFAISISLSGNNVLVSADISDVSAPNNGIVYLFDATTGDLLLTIKDPNPSHSNQFGIDVSISGNNALVGSLRDNAGARDAGAAYLFDATDGSLLQTFVNPNPQDFDLFGVSVSMSGNNFVVGSLLADISAPNGGAAYVFLESQPTPEGLSDQINSLENVSDSVKTSLNGPLNEAQKLLDDGVPPNDAAVCRKLTVFLNEVDAKEGNGDLTSEQADDLRTTAQSIQNSLGC